MGRYTASPLPFQGQKRFFISEFSRALRFGPRFDTILDLFGGSGLLAHAAKQEQPDARVIWNDFDNYAGRLAKIPFTNEVNAALREILGGAPKLEKVSPENKARVIDALAGFDLVGEIDWETISAGLLFPGNTIKAGGGSPLFQISPYIIASVPQTITPTVILRASSESRRITAARSTEERGGRFWSWIRPTCQQTLGGTPRPSTGGLPTTSISCGFAKRGTLYFFPQTNRNYRNYSRGLKTRPRVTATPSLGRNFERDTCKTPMRALFRMKCIYDSGHDKF